MSVSVLGDGELREMFTTYRALHAELPATAPAVDMFGEALFAAHLANVGAFNLTYGGRHAEEGAIRNIPVLLAQSPAVSWTRSEDERRAFVRSIRSLFYNCVSNGGCDFLPAKYRRTLDYAAQMVTDQLAGIE